MKNKTLKYKIRTVLVCIIILAIVIMLQPHLFRNTYTVIISSKQIEHKSDKKNLYLIYAQLNDGTVRVFKDTNSLLEFKFNSLDIYGGLRINRKYEIKVYGLRIPFLSSYQNIVEVKAVKPYNEWQ
ncbi:hypothetical protein J2Z42_000863 [Clostridium algifaecis]|uniref:DUF1523 domain-containing protein n=1 Tax=Clostridium algifaecis TaxID=1472040 RepID=A0ABS4KQ79_9CLOT|nr:DUF1523 family protein [Clostridium algifaecis]MBP2032198.1 hypothetical protein [Clostridium algifaecis]